MSEEFEKLSEDQLREKIQSLKDSRLSLEMSDDFLFSNKSGNLAHYQEMGRDISHIEQLLEARKKMTEVDYGSDTQPEDESGLAKLSKLADEQAKAEAKVAELEGQLESAKKALSDLSEHQIPQLMTELGVEKFKTTSGLEIEIDAKMRASIPKARTTEAVGWLEEHGFGDLVKRSFKAMFGREQQEEAKKFAELMREKGISAEEKEEVHPQTLSAWVKEQLEQGKDIPLDLFGAFWQRRAKIK
jgi:hypothetical protein